MTTRELIEDFLKQKRVAMVGVSRNPNDFSRALFREFLKQGYEVVPVNPQVPAVEGRKCLARVRDIKPAVDAVLLMTPPELTDQVVRECAEAGINRVWMFRALGTGAIHKGAVVLCHERGIRLIEGYCPFMFFPGAGLVHKLHRFFMKLAGSYPS